MKIKELLNDESKWVQGWYSVDKDGAVVPPNVPEACCWCLEGATMRCYGTDEPDITHNKIRPHLPKEYEGNVVRFNDDAKTTFEDIRKVIEKADV